MKSSYRYLFLAIFLIAIASCFVFQKNSQKEAVYDLMLENIEAIAEFEGGTNASYCYLKVNHSDTHNWKVFCDDNTNSNTIYPCPSESSGYYSDIAKDRCTK